MHLYETCRLQGRSQARGPRGQDLGRNFQSSDFLMNYLFMKFSNHSSLPMFPNVSESLPDHISPVKSAHTVNRGEFDAQDDIDSFTY